MKELNKTTKAFTFCKIIVLYRGRLVHSALFLNANKNLDKSNQNTRPRA